MPCQYCQKCEKLIDLDYDVEHFEEHEEEIMEESLSLEEKINELVELKK